MALSRETKRLLIWTDFFVANTWRYLLKSLWLFFPPILFILLAWYVFWHLPQGKDLLVIALESPDHVVFSPEFACFVIALLFWVYMTWYSTRLVAKAKHFQDRDENYIWEIFRVQTPRVLAFTCITIVLLAFLQLGDYGKPSLSSGWCNLLLLLSYLWYIAIYYFWTWFLKQKNKTKPDWIKFLNRVRWTTYIILMAGMIAVTYLKNFWGLVILLLGLQVGLVLLLILRREIDEAKDVAGILDEDSFVLRHLKRRSPFWKKIKYIILDDENKYYVRAFMFISAIAGIVYIASILSIKVAVLIGSFPFTLLAFGVLLGIGNFISYVSVLIRFNLHLVLFLIAVLLGNRFDPHYATVLKREHPQSFQNRQDLKQYLVSWLEVPGRKELLNDTSVKKFPLYFVMANGGASRSGFWTAHILSGLEDISEGKFSRHLFCLSGASGGSVGTSTFFTLLLHKNELKERKISFTEATEEYLRTDFLTYTLSHLMGPDIIRHFLPFLNYIIEDRATALAYSLEQAPHDSCFLKNLFAAPMSSLITQKEQPYSLPVICINTTRMQDASPAVISNILIQSEDYRKNYFNNRIDVLNMLDTAKDMKLSTAVVLGASFPYISPAGRINVPVIINKENGDKEVDIQKHYFVDGGYFDNSGAGVVNEMIIALNNMIRDSSDKELAHHQDKLKKLEFFVLHISNTDPKDLKWRQINPMVNDLFAPLQTLLGSYGTQTAVNDQRLKNYLYNLYQDTLHYTNIELYSNDRKSEFSADSIKYSMNWVISNFQITSMIRNLGNRGFFTGDRIKFIEKK